MSLFYPAKAVCGKCGADNTVDLAASVNADRRPDLRQAILDGSFQATTCRSCGTVLRLPAHLTYIDVARGQGTLVEAVEANQNWQDVEQEARAAFELSFGADAPAAARGIGAGLRPRLVFGWPALREKLVCGDLSLDDTVLELLKIAIIANVAKPPVADQTELRLTGGDAGSLAFAWVVSRTEQVIANLQVPSSGYADIEDAADDWRDLRAGLEGHLYVDVKRLLTGDGVTASRAAA
jgi:hypothetical protein